MALTTAQIDTLITIERTTACISVTSTLFFITTFIAIKQLRTLSNTLLFYASFANLFANVAALIGGAALSHPNAALCQFQGFLLEMFMQSDPFWSCAMAINVYLVFYHRFDARRLKRLYWLYGLICYGLPCIPAVFCLFYTSRGKGKMYGNATLWCWIDNDYALVRITSYYAPIWLAIITSLITYLLVGLLIFRHRSALLAANNLSSMSNTQKVTCNHERPLPLAQSPSFDIILAPEPAAPFSGTKTTHVEVVSHSPEPNTPSTFGRTASASRRYSINISSLPSPTATQHSFSSHFHHHRPKPTQKQKSTSQPIDKIKYAYTRSALLFCTSILITWVPASINRVYGLRHPDHPSFGLNAASAVVLPLQGFWNMVIFCVTSLGIWRGLWKEWKEKRARKGGKVKVKKLERDNVYLGGRRVEDGGDEGEKGYRESDWVGWEEERNSGLSEEAV